MRVKKKFRWRKFIIWTLSILIVLGASGLFAANYAINKFIESMANSIDLEVDGTSSTNAQPVETTATQSPLGEQESIIPSTQTSEPANVPDNNQPTDDPTNELNSGENSEDSNKLNPIKDEVGVYSVEVSAEKANEIKEKVSISDKTDVASILMGNLSISDIKLFQSLANGGMTVEEKREARKVLLEKLSPEEYNTLSSIAKKYGVSQGKSYDQIQEEEKYFSKEE